MRTRNSSSTTRMAAPALIVLHRPHEWRGSVTAKVRAAEPSRRAAHWARYAEAYGVQTGRSVGVEQSSAAAVARRGLRVLIVEDESLVSLSLQGVLLDLGHTVSG